MNVVDVNDAYEYVGGGGCDLVVVVMLCLLPAGDADICEIWVVVMNIKCLQVPLRPLRLPEC